MIKVMAVVYKGTVQNRIDLEHCIGKQQPPFKKRRLGVGFLNEGPIYGCGSHHRALAFAVQRRNAFSSALT